MTLLILEGCRSHSRRLPYVPGHLADECSTAEGKPVCAVVQQVDKGFRDNDPAAIANAYAEDADWMNAVGIHMKGKAQIEAFLKRLLSQPQIEGSTDSPMDIQAVRLIQPDIAVVYSMITTTGQKSIKDSKPLPPRKTHELQVLHMKDGQWKIVSDLISDENDALL